MQQLIVGIEVGLCIGRIIKSVYEEFIKKEQPTQCVLSCPLVKTLKENNV